MAQPILSPVFAWFTSAGQPASGYKLNTYFAGTSTPQATYTDSTLTTPNANPVVLNSQGYAPVWIGTSTFKFVLTDASNNIVWTADNVSQAGGGGGGGGTSSASEWVTDTATPTFVNGTTLTLVGDRTGTYHVGRRIKTTNTAGTIYSGIGVSIFGSGITTLGLNNDSGNLDSGLSTIAYGILDSTNVSYPTNIYPGVKNLLYNGGFDIWQRGAGGSASFTGISSRTYTADRWQAQQAGGSCAVTQVTGVFGRYGCKLQRTNGTSVTAPVILAQSLEINDCAKLAAAGTPLTLSAVLKQGANFSAASGNVTMTITAGKDASDTNVLAGYTSPLTVATQTFAMPTSPNVARFNITGTVPANAGYTEFGVQFSFTPVGTAGADDSITLELVQLEPSPNFTSFENTPFVINLLRCQRYFEKTFPYATAPAQNAGAASAFVLPATKAAATNNYIFFPFLAQKRITAAPLTFYNPSAANAQFRDITGAVDGTGTGATVTDRGAQLLCIGNAATAVGNELGVHLTVDADIP
jgi:hypothetical protein